MSRLVHLSVPANGIEPQQSHCDDAESTIQLTANCRINQCLAARDPFEAHFQAAMHQYHLRRSIRSITCRFGSRCASSARMRYTCIQHQHHYKHYFKCIHIRSPSSFHRTPDLSLSPSLLLMLTCSSEVCNAFVCIEFVYEEEERTERSRLVRIVAYFI